jgi:hypothetical protein
MNVTRVMIVISWHCSVEATAELEKLDKYLLNTTQWYRPPNKKSGLTLRGTNYSKRCNASTCSEQVMTLQVHLTLKSSDSKFNSRFNIKAPNRCQHSATQSHGLLFSVRRPHQAMSHTHGTLLLLSNLKLLSTGIRPNQLTKTQRICCWKKGRYQEGIHVGKGCLLWWLNALK